MFGKKKESDAAPTELGEAVKDDDGLDIPAPKMAASRPLAATSRPSAGAGPAFEVPKRPPLNAPAPRPRTEPAAPGSAVTAPPPVAALPTSPAAHTPPASAESKKLVVGRELRLKGEVTSCDVLVVEGSVELSLTDARQIQVASSGLFLGKVEVDEADIAGQFEGDLTVRERLVVRSGGRVQGRVRYGTIVIESGGRIAGEIESLSADAKRPTAAASAGLDDSRPPGPGNGGLNLPPASESQSGSQAGSASGSQPATDDR